MAFESETAVPSFLEPVLPVLETVRARADQIDQTGEWPAEDLRLLTDAGAMRWGIPRELGGVGLSALDLHLGYETIARASVSVALILSQRDSALALVEAAERSPYRAELAQFAERGWFATVGIAQLTTSRQGGPPALLASAAGEGFEINGVIPWSTGAAYARWIVAGAATDEGRQILFILRPDQQGVTVEPPAPLVALRSSWTAQISCQGTRIDRDDLLGGPADKVLGSRRGSLPLGQAFLALGLCRSGLDLIGAHRSAAASAASDRLEQQLLNLRNQVLTLSTPGREAEASAANPRLRGAVNDLALRIAHTAVTLYKGTALLAGHPAQRLAREAMFLLVWSCPNPVIDCTIELLTEVTSTG